MQLVHWPDLQKQGARRWQQLLDEHHELSSLEEYSDFVSSMLAASDFIFEQCRRHPDWLIELTLGGCFEEQMTNLLDRSLWERALNNLDETMARSWLRQRRNRILLWIAWFEFSGQIDVRDSIRWLSELADCAVVAGLNWLINQSQALNGLPCDEQGNPIPLCVLAMGKLGGSELNFSSDIDLIFCYPEQGMTQGGRRRIPNQQYFIRLGQQLIQLLGHVSADGFVFRVDMRLRPFGESGPLAVSYAAMEDYYQNHGRDWERYAMVKARCMNDGTQDQALLKLLRPFVYRRYIDFSVVESLRRMKAMILTEVRRKGLTDNIKLGRGGIREIEFIVQALQLIWGGRIPHLQQRSLLDALSVLGKEKILDETSVDILRSSYLFLRHLENLLQQIGDQQIQDLPEDKLNQSRLAWALGEHSWADAYHRIIQVLQKVSRLFDDTFGHPLPEEQEVDGVYDGLWLEEDDEICHKVSSITEPFYQLVRQFRQRSLRRVMGEKGRITLDQLMPGLLQFIAGYSKPEKLAERIFLILEKILTRTAYLQLLLENPGALKQLLRLCDASILVAEQLSNYPLLLDELLDPQTLYQPVDESCYAVQLDEFMLRIEPDDLEQQIEGLRQFKQIQMLKIAAADIADVLPLMKVSDHLTALAEALTTKVVDLAWQQMVVRYGLPSGVIDVNTRQRGFAVIGYGKFGGIELGYGSDLDMVFIHNCQSYAPTDGLKSIDSKQFYLRLAQRIMHLFQTRSSAGVLYEVDMRLRPSGNSGLLVTSLDSFRDYQREQAWTWEHQALVRSRAIDGDLDIIASFNKIRQFILGRFRDEKTLQQEIVDMREKMRIHLDRSDDSMVDLKQAPGGMVDIEFVAQYLVLLYSNQNPELAKWSDNIRIFETAMQVGLLSECDMRTLMSTYIEIRNEGHRQVLQAHSRLVARKKLSDLLSCMKKVEAIWGHFLGI
ncbi:MAG: Bifunctional glutamine synthetase adenylyltransferase/adenylyl-removing enzyme [Candidatus Celerinatantimonas neptuna]|nr:MAG: Bifunctional glutamine synthetase adenylyltransferase/adenylyl-removing enzyme [Candidatus Celerinatantimonas neptuna]